MDNKGVSYFLIVAARIPKIAHSIGLTGAQRLKSGLRLILKVHFRYKNTSAYFA